MIGYRECFMQYESSIYRQVVRMSERKSAPKDNLNLHQETIAQEQVKEELRSLGCPVDEYQFDWFSTSRLCNIGEASFR